LKNIATGYKGFGYVPLSVYIIALQKGIQGKKAACTFQSPQGFAAVMPPHTDWNRD